MRKSTLFLAAAALTALGWGCDDDTMAPEMPAPPEETVNEMTADVQTHASQGPVAPVAGAVATLETEEAGIFTTLRTGDLVPEHAYTVWLVIINAPENCAESACTAGDVLGNPDGVQAEVAWAAGSVANTSGEAGFVAALEAGAVPGGWFGNGLTDPMGADVHLILMDHGPAIPGLLAEQVSTLRGGCTDESVPPPFPAVAHADGTPGPNTCRLVQVAVFEQ